MITITKSASLKIKEMMERQDRILRFGVTGGGCSGLSYMLGFADKKEEDDVYFECEGIKIIIREKELPIIKGTTIEYKESLMGGGFIINNPNAIATCGCGSSFRTKEEEGNPEKCE